MKTCGNSSVRWWIYLIGIPSDFWRFGISHDRPPSLSYNAQRRRFFLCLVWRKSEEIARGAEASPHVVVVCCENAGLFSKVSPIWRYGSLFSDGNAESMRGALPCGGGHGAGVVLCPWGVHKFRARRRETVGEGYKKIPRTAMGCSGDEGGERAISNCRPWRGDCRSRLCRV